MRQLQPTYRAQTQVEIQNDYYQYFIVMFVVTLQVVKGESYHKMIIIHNRVVMAAQRPTSAAHQLFGNFLLLNTLCMTACYFRDHFRARGTRVGEERRKQQRKESSSSSG